MNKVTNKHYQNNAKVLDYFILNYDTEGESFGNQDRNSLKTFLLEDEKLNVKSFKKPNIFNKVAYQFLRKGKAQRSFEYANKLNTLNIGTPKPVAYYEFKDGLLFGKSYYISQHIDFDIMYRDLCTNLDYPNHETILRAFTRFTFNLHENNINFLDHSPGNTLIKTNGDGYDFYLVDLNRMNFEALSFDKRIKNFAKLTTLKSMVEIMSDEYAKCSNQEYDIVFNLMWHYTLSFQNAYVNKRALKKKLKFWKK